MQDTVISNGCKDNNFQVKICNFFLLLLKGLVTPANGYVPEGKRTKVCRIWLSGDKINLLYRSKFSRSVCGAWKLSNDRTSNGHVTGKRTITGCVPDNKQSINGYHSTSNGLVPDKTEVQRMRTGQNVLPT